MILGADEPLSLTPTSFGPPPPPITGAVAAFVLPTAVLLVVKRDRNPFVWTAFGLLPAIWAGARLITAIGARVEKK